MVYQIVYRRVCIIGEIAFTCRCYEDTRYLKLCIINSGIGDINIYIYIIENIICIL